MLNLKVGDTLFHKYLGEVIVTRIDENRFEIETQHMIC